MKWRAAGTNTVALLFGLTGWIGVTGRQANNYFRKFVRYEDSTEFSNLQPTGDGFIRSYLSTVQRRKAGTLHNGNGTIIYYNEDGTVREVKTFANGVAK